MKTSASERRVERVRYELKMRDVEVVHIAPLGENFVSITFQGEALEDFVSGSFDDHVKFMFAGEDGEMVRRDYTPRHFNRERRELTIEFARHGEGRASAWAEQARVGQPAVIGGPRGSMIIPVDYDWHLMVADSTGLPAISRRLEELPPQTKAFIFMQGQPGDRRDLDGAAEVQVQWVESEHALIELVAAWQLPEGEGFAWCAGEAAAMSKLRAILVAEKGMPKESMRVAAYWKRGASSYHLNLD